jgi:hypothetical protein
MTMITTTRNADLSSLVSILRDQHARKIDVVAPAANFGFRDAALVVAGVEVMLGEDGVTDPNGTYHPTAPFDGDVADKLRIPVAYLRRLREERPDLYDVNTNGWLRGRHEKRRFLGIDPVTNQAHSEVITEGIAGDARSFLLRLFRGDEGQHGVARALLSDRYAAADNLDVLMSALDGVRAAGVEVDVAKADLTDRRMIVKMHAPSIATEAVDLLRGYRSPFSGQTGDECPVVFAGLRITNSETGDGRFTITPEVTVQVCTNGMTMTTDMVAQTHIGSRLDAGVVRWSQDTEQKNLEVVKAKTRDAVATFLSPGYLHDAVARLTRRAGEEVGTTREAVVALTKPLGYTETQQDLILEHFVRGGQFTRGGVVNAITSASQTVEDGDAAHDMDLAATRLLLV